MNATVEALLDQMQYNVAQLLKEPTGATRRVHVEGGLEISGGAAASYRGGLELLRTHQGLLVRGTLEASVGSSCSRCLGDFASQCRLDVEEEFYPQVDVSTGRKLEQFAENEGTTIDLDHVLDVAEVLRQYAIAAQPIKSLCRESCQGLCQECGVDLNAESCICSKADIDPRWNALAALLNQSND